MPALKQGLKPETEGKFSYVTEGLQLPKTMYLKGDTAGILEKKILWTLLSDAGYLISPNPTSGLLKSYDNQNISPHISEHLLLAVPHPLRITKLNSSQWEVQEHLFINSNKIRTGSALSQLKLKSQIIIKQEISLSRKLTAGYGNKSKGLIPSPYF